MTAIILLDLTLVAVILAFRFLILMEEVAMVSLTPLTDHYYNIILLYQILMSVVMALTTVNKYAITHMEPTTVSAVTVMNLKVTASHVQV